MWLTWEYARESERLFSCIADGSGESDRLFHSLRKRLDRHVFPLLSWECCGGNEGMEGNRAIGVVIDGRIRKYYLCLI